MQIKSFQERCSERAKSTLKSIGVEYPLYDNNISPHDNYKRMVEYRIKESALIVQYMACAPKLAPDKNTFFQKRKVWGACND